MEGSIADVFDKGKLLKLKIILLEELIITMQDILLILDKRWETDWMYS